MAACVEVAHPQKIILDDPSEFRPEVREAHTFRDFRIHNVPERVVRTYDLMHTNQTVDFVKDRMQHWMKFDHAEMTIMEILDQLNELVDESDPDIDLPNAMHAFQTAEGIRKHHPDKPWFQLTGLIHDIGKIMHLWGEPQWATVGDTFVVGCAPDPSIVFGLESFAKNPDLQDSRYNTKLGMYTPNCGLRNVLMSWGHDEYLYRVLLANKHSLPEEALSMIRFHSFYPYHTCGAYKHLADEKDAAMLPWILEFNKFDLYTKAPEMPPVEELREYYQGLIDQYVPGKLRW
ncbi:inositol oxygenase [Elysia marginata]|uniref:Inositol oxygenase n=1 Tax=Elysia marginata TaxID=1093978 RepID=A0AAV4H7P2_9GAST|nr:inositol oxygenase [Elysia marginata]